MFKAFIALSITMVVSQSALAGKACNAQWGNKQAVTNSNREEETTFFYGSSSYNSERFKLSALNGGWEGQGELLTNVWGELKAVAITPAQADKASSLLTFSSATTYTRSNIPRADICAGVCGNLYREGLVSYQIRDGNLIEISSEEDRFIRNVGQGINSDQVFHWTNPNQDLKGYVAEWTAYVVKSNDSSKQTLIIENSNGRFESTDGIDSVGRIRMMANGNLGVIINNRLAIFDFKSAKLAKMPEYSVFQSNEGKWKSSPPPNPPKYSPISTFDFVSYYNWQGKMEIATVEIDAYNAHVNTIDSQNRHWAYASYQDSGGQMHLDYNGIAVVPGKSIIISMAARTGGFVRAIALSRIFFMRGIR